MTEQLKIRVLRVEHNTTGEGPYRCKDPYVRMNMMGEDHWDANHPTPVDDSMHPPWRESMRSSHHYHGCEDRPSLERWFRKYGFALTDNGFVVAEYEARHYIKSDRTGQVLFDRLYADRLDDNTLEIWWR